MNESINMLKRFVVTLKSPIKLSVPRIDGSPLLIKTSTLLVDWPCRLTPTAESPNDIEPREGSQIDFTVIRFTDDNHGQSWFAHWKTADGLTDPMPVQMKRDNILSRQEVTSNQPDSREG